MDLLLHELGFQWGGAERVFEALAALNTDARLAIIAGRMDVLRYHFPNRTPEIFFPALVSNKHVRAAVPYLARSLPNRELRAERIVLSSYAMSRWLPSRTGRLIYCHAPMRQIWHGAPSYSRGHRPEAIALRRLIPWLRRVDQTASQPDDKVVVPSRRVADLVRAYHGIEAVAVVPPPVDEALYRVPLTPKEGHYFIWVGRIVEPVKRLGSLIGMFDRLDMQHQLVIVGEGRSRTQLERSAPSNVRFVGWRKAEELSALVAGAAALILPSMEDFGISAAEALALGTPVIVSHDAGIADWVEHGKNGWIVDGSEESFRNAVSSAARGDRDSARNIRESARVFRLEPFHSEMRRCEALMGWV